MKVLTDDRDELLLAAEQGPIDRSRLHRQMTKDDETRVTLSQEGKIPGVSGTLTVSKTKKKPLQGNWGLLGYSSAKSLQFSGSTTRWLMVFRKASLYVRG